MNGQHVQYSKIFTSAVGLAYLVQVAATIVLVCVQPITASYLIDILGTTTGLVCVVFTCYTGNSAVEKAVVNKALPGAAAKNMKPGGGAAG